jgi:hypothetical protein
MRNQEIKRPIHSKNSFPFSNLPFAEELKFSSSCAFQNLVNFTNEWEINEIKSAFWEIFKKAMIFCDESSNQIDRQSEMHAFEEINNLITLVYLSTQSHESEEFPHLGGFNLCMEEDLNK